MRVALSIMLMQECCNPVANSFVNGKMSQGVRIKHLYTGILTAGSTLFPEQVNRRMHKLSNTSLSLKDGSALSTVKSLSPIARLLEMGGDVSFYKPTTALQTKCLALCGILKPLPISKSHGQPT